VRCVLRVYLLEMLLTRLGVVPQTSRQALESAPVVAVGAAQQTKGRGTSGE
jgi:hypothetical protein